MNTSIEIMLILIVMFIVIGLIFLFHEKINFFDAICDLFGLNNEYDKIMSKMNLEDPYIKDFNADNLSLGQTLYISNIRLHRSKHNNYKIFLRMIKDNEYYIVGKEIKKAPVFVNPSKELLYLIRESKKISEGQEENQQITEKIQKQIIYDFDNSNKIIYEDGSKYIKLIKKIIYKIINKHDFKKHI